MLCESKVNFKVLDLYYINTSHKNTNSLFIIVHFEWQLICHSQNKNVMPLMLCESKVNFKILDLYYINTSDKNTNSPFHIPHFEWQLICNSQNKNVMPLMLCESKVNFKILDSYCTRKNLMRTKTHQVGLTNSGLPCQLQFGTTNILKYKENFIRKCFKNAILHTCKAYLIGLVGW